MTSIDCFEYTENDFNKIINDISIDEILFRAVHSQFEAYLKENGMIHRSFFRKNYGLSIDKLCNRKFNELLNDYKSKFKELKYVIKVKNLDLREKNIYSFSKPLEYNLFHAILLKSEDINNLKQMTKSQAKYLSDKCEVIVL